MEASDQTIVKALTFPSGTIKYFKLTQIEKPIADLFRTPLGSVIKALTVELPYTGATVRYELTDLTDIP